MPGYGSHETDPGLIPGIVRSVTRGVSRRPVGVLWLVVLSASLSLGVAVRFLSFKTERSDLIDQSADFQQRWQRYTDAFGGQSDAVVVVEASDRATIQAVLEDLGKRIAREDRLFERVLFKTDPRPLRIKALQYFSPQELESCLGRLERYSDVLLGNWQEAGLQATTERLTQQLGSDDARAAAEAEIRSEMFVDSLHEAFAGHPFQTPWPPLLPHARQADLATFEPVYQVNEDGTMGFLLLTPLESGQDFSGTSQSIDRLRELIAEVRQRHRDVQIGLTGIPVLESDEMRRSQSDMTIASGVSFLGVGTLLVVGFRGIRHPLLAMIMLLVGLAWSLGYATLFVGHLNILSVSFTAILVGLGIDFAIHYLARYIEVRHEGVALRPALRRTSSDVGTGIVTAAVTTALAFFCATLTSFLGVAELGVIAGGGILLCCAATFLVLPALVAIADRNVEPRRLPTPFQGALLKRLTTNHPWLVSTATLMAILIVGVGAVRLTGGKLTSRVKYDANLLNLQADEVDSVEVLNRVFRESNGSLLYAVSIRNDPHEVRRLKREFERLPTVARVEELASHLPQYSVRETGLLVQAIHAQLSHVSEFPRQLPRVDPQSLGRALESFFLALDVRGTERAVAAADRLNEVLNRLERLPLESQVQVLAEYQYAMLAALKAEFEAVAEISDPQPVSPTDFPPSLRNRFVSDHGEWLLRVYPSEQIWDAEPLARFVADVRTVDPDATGTPLQNHEAARQIQDSYLNAAVYALAVIWIVLLVDSVRRGPLLIGLLTPLALMGLAVTTLEDPQSLLTPMQMLAMYLCMLTSAAGIFDFPNVRNTFLTLVPPVGGGILMFGVLGFCGIDLNPANLIVLPLILGIGVDDGVHVIHDFRMQSGSYRTSSSTINAIMLTSLTSMIGFGSMMLAAHRGLASLGLVLVIGVGSCLFVSLVTLPAILTLVSRREQAAHGRGPWPDSPLDETRTPSRSESEFATPPTV